MLSSLVLLALALFPLSPPEVHEVAFIDLSGVTPRTNLRHPPSPPPKCKPDGSCSIAGFSMGVVIGDCGVGANEPRALHVTTLRIDVPSARRGDRVGYELRIENVGSVPLSLPVYPHLADLQPEDESAVFRVHELGFGLRFSDGNSAPLTRITTLYSVPERTDSAITLQPGESMRVRSSFVVPADYQPAKANTTLPLKAVPYLNLRTTTFHPREGGVSENLGNECPRVQLSEPQDFTIAAGSVGTR